MLSNFGLCKFVVDINNPLMISDEISVNDIYLTLTQNPTHVFQSLDTFIKRAFLISYYDRAPQILSPVKNREQLLSNSR